MSNAIENVLILQGGGSLGAFGCGVYKALAKNKIKIDIIAGTSIGGLNASIIAGSKEDHPEKALEQYWLEVGEGSNNGMNFNFPLGEERSPQLSPSESQTPIASTTDIDHSHTHISQLKSTMSFYSSATSYIGNQTNADSESRSRYGSGGNHDEELLHRTSVRVVKGS